MNFKTGLIHSLLLLMLRPASPCWVPVASSFFLQFLGERRASLWPTIQQNSWTSLLSGPLGSRGWGMPGPFGVGLDQVAIPITNTGVQKVEWVTPIPGHWGGPLDSGVQTWIRVQFLPSLLIQHLNFLFPVSLPLQASYWSRPQPTYYPILKLWWLFIYLFF